MLRRGLLGLPRRPPHQRRITHNETPRLGDAQPDLPTLVLGAASTTGDAVSRPKRVSREPWVDLAAAVLRRCPSLPGALCAGRAQLFDATDAADRARAISLCCRCPARYACAAWIASLPKPSRPPGVVAGRYRRGAS